MRFSSLVSVVATFSCSAYSLVSLANNNPFQAPPRPAPLAIEYNFGSIGEGIDGNTMEALENTLFSYFRDAKISKITRQNLGREGEAKICIEGLVFQTARSLEQDVLKLAQPAETVRVSIKLKCE